MAIDLSTITAGDGSQGFVLQGELAGDQSGTSVASAGDVNGDGFDDMIIGAPSAGGPGDSRPNAGDSYVVFGKASGFAATIDLASITAGDGSQGFVLQGELADDRSGFSVASAGDVNGDGYDDLIVGARFADGPGDTRPYAGDSYVVFGKASGFTPTLDLAAITAGDGSQGFVLQGESPSDFAGFSVASAGDVNGDGFDDLIIGAPYADGPEDGRDAAGDSYVVFGKASGFSPTFDLATITTGDGSQGFVLQGELTYDTSGFSVASAGDVNGDGFDDLIVGARFADGPGDSRPYAGDAYVVFGKATGFAPTLDLAAITTGDGSQGFVLQGELTYDAAGFSVASAGDVNGDGLDDLIVGARGAGGPGDARSGAGDSYVVFGKDTGFGATIDLAAITAGDGSQGFVLQGEQADDQSGRSVASAGDVNGDGFDDLIVGASYADGPADGQTLAGDSYVVFGKASGFGATIDLAAIAAGDGSQGFAIRGEMATDFSGTSVSSAGDINGDGFDDLMIGASGGDGPADLRASAGDSYVLFGSATIGGSVNHLTQPAGGDGTDVQLGSASRADVLVGGRSNDILKGAGGADVLRGGEGDDMLGIADAGFARVSGGTGTDSLQLTGAMTLDDTDFRRMSGLEAIVVGNQAVNLTLGRNAADAFGGIVAAGFLIGIDGTASISTAQTVDASSFNQGIAADFSNNAAGVTVVGGLRDSSVAGGMGSDSLSGNAGSDTLTGGAGGDVLNGAAGNDSLAGNDGNDSAGGGDGLDTLAGGQGNDTLSGGADNDALDGAAGSDSLFGNEGNDSANGGDGQDTVGGGQGDDMLFGGGDGDLLNGALGNDSIYGGATATSDVTLGADTITGGDGDDLIRGQAGADVMRGDAGLDDLGGGSEDDQLYGGADNDLLNGAAGADTLNGGTGSDTLFGGADDDRFVFLDGDGADTVSDFADNGVEKFDLSGLIVGAQSFDQLAITDTPGPGVTVDYGTGSFLVQNINSVAQIDPLDFLF